MRIRAVVHIAGQGFSLAPGDITDQFPEAEALRLVAKNAAVLVNPAPSVSIAVEAVPAMETRVDVPQTFPVKHRKGKK